LGGSVIIDPSNLLARKDLDMLKKTRINLVIFTHAHADHYNPDSTIELYDATGATILCESYVANSLKDAIDSNRLTKAMPGKTYTFGDIRVSVIKGTHFGPINLYFIRIGTVRIFHGADSGYVSFPPKTGHGVKVH
jgi:L-ascorbate metabolism protein UlaG (beta-lactamase superfamily)